MEGSFKSPFDISKDWMIENPSSKFLFGRIQSTELNARLTSLAKYDAAYSRRKSAMLRHFFSHEMEAKGFVSNLEESSDCGASGGISGFSLGSCGAATYSTVSGVLGFSFLCFEHATKEVTTITAVKNLTEFMIYFPKNCGIPILTNYF
jgi:hypothetical protein